MNLRKMATLAFVGLLSALTILFSGCQRMAPVVRDTQTMPVMAEDIPIGIAISLTGPFAEPYGLPMQRGLELARQEINMRSDTHLTFITVDAESTPAGSVAAVDHLVDQGVPAIVGIGISTHLEQAFPIAQRNGVVAFSPISSATGLSALGDYIFRAGLTVGVLNSDCTVVTHQILKYKTAALIYDISDTYSRSSNATFEETLEILGVEILTVETFRSGETNFSEQLSNIKRLAPEAVFVSTLAPEMPKIIAQAREIGIPDDVHIIVPDLTRDEVQKAGLAAEGVITFSGWYSMAETPGNQAFVSNYKATYGIAPERWAAEAYATLYILANAIDNAGSMDAAAIRDALAETWEYPTILGNFSFDPDGEAIYDPNVFIVEDGELQLFQ